MQYLSKDRCENTPALFLSKHPFAEKIIRNDRNTGELTFFVVVNFLRIVYNAISYEQLTCGGIDIHV